MWMWLCRPTRRRRLLTSVRMMIVFLLHLKEHANMALTVQDVLDAVAAEKTVEDSAIALINSIPALIAAAGANAGIDPATLQPVIDAVNAQKAALQTAVTNFTPPAAPPAA